MTTQKADQIKRWQEMQRQSVLRYQAKLRSTQKRRRKQRISKLTGEPIISRQKAEKRLWEAFSLYIRQRDQTCVLAHLGGCGGSLQAGHVIKRGNHAIKYDEQNVNAQCASHNYLHERHPHIYIKWFIQTYGIRNWNRLNDLIAEDKENKSISTAEALRLTKIYQSRILKI